MDRIRVINNNEAIELCNRPEGVFFDRKAKDIDGRGVQKIICALANTDGGELVVGVEDEKNGKKDISRWDGFEKTEEFDKTLQAILSVKPTVDFQYEFLRIEGLSRNYILHVSIERSVHLHETADQNVYERHGTMSVPVKGPDNIIRLKSSKGIYSEEDNTINNEEISLEIVESVEFIEYRANSPVSDVDNLTYLKRLSLLNKQLNPTYAAILLFHNNPSDVLPRQCAIKVVRYDTSQEDPDREELRESYPIEGPCRQIIKQTYNQINLILRKMSIWHLHGLKNPTYPEDAIWEILTNAVIHRDYGISDNILIRIYNNRIEFKSPGRLPAYVKISNILENRYSRNPKIVRHLSKYQDAPNKDIGEGMNTTFQAMKKNGLSEPIVKEENGYFLVTLPYKSNNEPEYLIKEFIKNHGSINNTQARHLLGLGTQQEAYSILSKLRDADDIFFTSNVWKMQD